MKRQVKTAILFTLLYCLPWSGNLMAYPIDLISFLRLPPHCKAKYAQMYKMGKVTGITIQPERYQPERWKKRIGKPFRHFHHYCPGLIDVDNLKHGTASKGIIKRAEGRIQ